MEMKKRPAKYRCGRVFLWRSADGSGRFGLHLGGVATLAFLTRQGHRGAHAFGHEFHQALDHPFVRVDPGAGQHFAPVARPGPTGDLVRAIAIFLVIRDRIVKRSQNDSREELAGALTLLVIERGAVDEDSQFVFLFLLFVIRRPRNMTFSRRFGMPPFA